MKILSLSVFFYSKIKKKLFSTFFSICNTNWTSIFWPKLFFTLQAKKWFFEHSFCIWWVKSIRADLCKKYMILRNDFFRIWSCPLVLHCAVDRLGHWKRRQSEEEIKNQCHRHMSVAVSGKEAFLFLNKLVNFENKSMYWGQGYKCIFRPENGC